LDLAQPGIGIIAAPINSPGELAFLCDITPDAANGVILRILQVNYSTATAAKTVFQELTVFKPSGLVLSSMSGFACDVGLSSYTNISNANFTITMCYFVSDIGYQFIQHTYHPNLDKLPEYYGGLYSFYGNAAAFTYFGAKRMESRAVTDPINNINVGYENILLTGHPHAFKPSFLLTPSVGYTGLQNFSSYSIPTLGMVEFHSIEYLARNGVDYEVKYSDNSTGVSVTPLTTYLPFLPFFSWNNADFPLLLLLVLLFLLLILLLFLLLWLLLLFLIFS